MVHQLDTQQDRDLYLCPACLSVKDLRHPNASLSRSATFPPLTGQQYQIEDDIPCYFTKKQAVLLRPSPNGGRLKIHRQFGTNNADSLYARPLEWCTCGSRLPMRSVSKLLQEGTTTPRLYSPKPGGLRKKTRPAPLLNMRLTPRPNLDQPDTPPSRRSGLSQPSSSSKPTLRTPSPAKVGLIVVSHELPYQCQNGNCAKSYKKEEFERLTDGSEWYSGRANHAHTFPFGTTIGKSGTNYRRDMFARFPPGSLYHRKPEELDRVNFKYCSVCLTGRVAINPLYCDPDPTKKLQRSSLPKHINGSPRPVEPWSPLSV